MSRIGRREMLKALAVTGAATAMPSVARAQTGGGGYRALVCVFLYGGNDGINTVPAIQSSQWSAYQSVRKSLALGASQVVDLNGQIGLHHRLGALKNHWDSGKMAVVNNVGVLSQPMSQAQYLEWRDLPDNRYIPDNLFSHSDQQVLWEVGHADIMTRTGWGARLMRAMGSEVPVYAFERAATRFGQGETSQQVSLPTAGSQLGLEGFSGSESWTNARLAALQALVNHRNPNQLQTGYAGAQSSAFETSSLLGDMLAQAPSGGAADAENPEISEAFSHFSGAADNKLSRQLYQVAKMIKHRSTVGGNRHIYFVALDEFDHHADQINRHDKLMQVLGSSLDGFQQAMNAMGISEQVTLFTESEFGRTFKPNGSQGTDHGWGSQQLVLGGAVNGGQAYGPYPSLQLGGPDDSGAKPWEHHGRWIPTYSLEQYAAPLISWFAPGLGNRIDDVMPNLYRFNAGALSYMLT